MTFRAVLVDGPSSPLAFTLMTAKYQIPLSSVGHSYEVCEDRDENAVIEVVGSRP